MIPLFSSTIQRSEMDAVLTCLVEEKVGPGEVAAKLEKKVCEFFDAPFAVALRSPALALDLALQLLNLPEKSNVMISALAPWWQYQCVLRSGFKPVVLDVDRKTALISCEEVEKAASEGASVLVLHETLGNLPQFESFEDLNLIIIEDISQSAGAYYADQDLTDSMEAFKNAEDENKENNEVATELGNDKAVAKSPVLKKAGTFGTFAILGLEEHDILTSGGGAVLFVNNRRDTAPLKNLAQKIPSTGKLPDINAALGFVQLKNIKKNMQVRLEMEKLFKHSLMSSKHEGLNFGTRVINPVYNFSVILERGFKEVKKYTSKKKVEIALAFEDSVVSFLDDELPACENAKALALRTVLFPLYPMLGRKKLQTVAKVLSTLP